MQRFAFSMQSDAKWKRTALLLPRDTFLWAPPVEIRMHLDSPAVETWFHPYSDGPTLSRFSMRSMAHLLAHWRSFLIKCQSHKVNSKNIGFFSNFFEKRIFEDKIWTDDRGRYVGNLQLIQIVSGAEQDDLRIRLSSHATFATFVSFQAWLDILVEMHSPFLEPQHSAPE